jgi:hypothetical protein
MECGWMETEKRSRPLENVPADGSSAACWTRNGKFGTPPFEAAIKHNTDGLVSMEGEWGPPAPDRPPPPIKKFIRAA